MQTEEVRRERESITAGLEEVSLVARREERRERQEQEAGGRRELQMMSVARVSQALSAVVGLNLSTHSLAHQRFPSSSPAAAAAAAAPALALAAYALRRTPSSSHSSPGHESRAALPP